MGCREQKRRKSTIGCEDEHGWLNFEANANLLVQGQTDRPDHPRLKRLLYFRWRYDTSQSIHGIGKIAPDSMHMLMFLSHAHTLDIARVTGLHLDISSFTALPPSALTASDSDTTTLSDRFQLVSSLKTVDAKI